MDSATGDTETLPIPCTWVEATPNGAWTTDDQMATVYASGVLDFWHEPAEDGYLL